MARTQITLNGVPLLAASAFGWAMTSGTRAFFTNAVFPRNTAEALNRLAGSFNGQFVLKIDTRNGIKIFQDIWLLSDREDDNPFIKSVQLADLRWRWVYKHVLRRYNMRRRIGFRNLSFNTESGDVLDVNPDFFFAPYSLKDPNDLTSRWTAVEVLENIFEKLEVTNFDITRNAQRKLAELPVENLEIDDNGADAIARVLASFPSITLYVNPLGVVRVIDKADGTEEDELSLTGPEIVGGGHATKITNELTRPEKVHVLFTREIETRYDFEEFDPDVTIAETPLARFAENVISVPDPSIEIPNVGTVTMGTWVRVDRYVDAITADTGNPTPGTLQGVTAARFFEVMREAFVKGMDLWAALALTGSIEAPDVDWGARLAALQDAYRRIYRINREWVDRILRFEPYLVATIDPENGTRAPAKAFGNYAVIPSQRMMFRAFNADPEGGVPWIINQEHFDGGDLDGTVRPMPMNVVIEDADQGIISLNARLDPYRLNEMILPSLVEGVPVDGEYDGSAAITFDSVSLTGAIPRLAANYKTSILITSVPAAPNDNRQLHRVVIDQGMLVAAGLLGESKPALGPIREIRIAATTETARVKWSDLEEDKARIERAFGFESEIDGGLQVDADADNDGFIDMDDLTVNALPQGSIDPNLASLQDIAMAAAARIYAQETDRFLGSRTSANLNLEPAGTIEEVRFNVSPDGSVLVTIDLPDTPPELNMFAFLPAGTRANVLKEVRNNRS